MYTIHTYSTNRPMVVGCIAKDNPSMMNTNRYTELQGG